MKFNKKKISIILIILVLIFAIFFSIKMFKKLKRGDNITSQEIVDYILNVNSYKTKIYVEVSSNKNKNKYVIKQEYNTENGDIEEVVEPSNIEGVKIVKQNNNLRIENTNLNLKTIFEYYNELESNSLDLSSFINDYKNNNGSKYEEKESEIIMYTQNNSNIYTMNKILYIDKEKKLPIKLIIKDNNQKMTINIQYNEIQLN